MTQIKLEPQIMKELHQRNNWRPAIYLLCVYVGIVLSLGLYYQLDRLWLLPVFIVVIAGFQHQLSIIQHEANHFLLFKNRKWNEFFGSLSAFSIGFTMAYREIHLHHHRELGSDTDPDLPNYQPFPLTKAQFALDLLLLLTGTKAIIQFIKQMFVKKTKTRAKKMDRGLIGVILTQLAIAAAFWWSGHWTGYLILWLLPLVTLAKTFTYLRNVSEHTISGEAHANEMHRMRTILCGPIEQFLFAPMYFNYHAEHHLYPGIPYYNLPKAHEILSQHPEYNSQIEIYPYGYVRFLFSKALR